MKTIFLRVAHCEEEQKPLRLLAAVKQNAPEGVRFQTELESFGQIPKSPFAYWASDRVRETFQRLPAFEGNGRTAKQGLATADDFRFVRLAVEIPWAERGVRWFPFAKGGAFSRYYADIHLVVDWEEGGYNVYGYPKAYVRNPDYYHRPGITWPRRTTSGLSIRILPGGCVFGDKGPAAFVADDSPPQLLALLVLMGSQAFRDLVSLQLAATDVAARSYEVGVIQRTPVPALTETQTTDLSQWARQAWSLARSLDTADETTHVFVLPSLLQQPQTTLTERAAAWEQQVAAVGQQLAAIQSQIDTLCFQLYDLSPDEVLQETETTGQIAPDETQVDSDDDEGEEADAAPSAADVSAQVRTLVSYVVGALFGRFDLRRVTESWPMPSEDDPFAALPVCSPGMLTGTKGLPVEAPPDSYPFDFPTDGLWVDDAGHPQDIVGAVRRVFDVVFSDGLAIWNETAEILGYADWDLRPYLAQKFFAFHVKQYSKSRRKAPIYWQLSTTSGSYSVWLYVHRATGDTLFKAINQYILPKIDHETSKLGRLLETAGKSPNKTQRDEIDRQQGFVDELNTFKADVEKVAPLWKPDLNDGMVILGAPLWRLFPKAPQWQKECLRVWNQLVDGEYDWATMAKHLWPDRVLARCATDRSIAIAHGLESEFWDEEPDGKWIPKPEDKTMMTALVTASSKPAVQAAVSALMATESRSTKTVGYGKERSGKAKGRKSASNADGET